MQICRYNIGGSGWGTADVKNFRYGANIERCPARTHLKNLKLNKRGHQLLASSSRTWHSRVAGRHEASHVVPG